MLTDEIVELAAATGRDLQSQGLTLAVAESCTGGLIAAAITASAGSSAWFERGFVTYSNAAKQEMLGIEGALLEEHGAVSETVAVAMAAGVLTHSRADVTLAVTGIAGPGGGSEEKPVGTVWLAWAGAGRSVVTRRERFEGDREAVRRQSVAAALEGLREFIVGAETG